MYVCESETGIASHIVGRCYSCFCISDVFDNQITIMNILLVQSYIHLSRYMDK